MDDPEPRPDPAVEIAHEPENSRYVVRLGGQIVGQTQYRARPDGARVFFHTETDPTLEGHGLASQLISGALDDTRAGGSKVVAECPFVRAYVRKRPDDYRDLVVDPQL
jgi:predicted GNAT family acetyltransferase